MAAVLALLASLTYGAADFLGGMMGRRIPVTMLILWSQTVSMVLALIAALMFPADRVTQADIGWGAFAGAAGIIGIYFLYQGLAQGRMAVVSPVAALVGAILPMGVGIAMGDRPLAVEWIGIALALPAIWLVAAVGDMLANVFVLLAFRSGMLTLVAVLTSLYPAVTVLLAVWILSEPIGLRQRLGLLLALLAVALIAI